MIHSNNEEGEDKNVNDKIDLKIANRKHHQQHQQDQQPEQREQMKEDQSIKDGQQQCGEQQSDSDKPKRNPFCSRCRNHGKSAQVKGHKRHCEYRDCQCVGCKLVECRQIVSAAQIKRRRYQKQDEECGCRIEISPPVLTRPQNNDPATLIAETLIGSPRRRNSMSPIAQKPLPTTTGTIAPSVVSAHPPALTGPQGHLYSHLHDHHGALSATPPAITANKSTNLSIHNNSNLQTSAHQHNLNHHQQHHLGFKISSNHTQNHNSHHRITDPSTISPVSTLSNTLQLFQFPDSILSAAAAANVVSLGLAHQASAVGPPVATATNTKPSEIPVVSSDANGCSSDGPSKLSPHDQLSLADDIHRTFGPLAVYAWLRSEQFDFHRIRKLIEISRSSYNDLMDSKSAAKYRLDNRDHLASSSSDSNSRSSCISVDSSERSQQQRGHPRPVSSDQHQGSATTSSQQQQQQTSNVATCHQGNPSSTKDSLASSPVYTFGSSVGYAANENNNHILDCQNSLLTNNGSQQAHRHIISALSSSAASLSHSISNAAAASAHSHGIPWPGLKLSTSGGFNPSQLIHPHLLPHFMHHHPLLVQHQQYQLSLNSALNGSGPSTSS